MSIPLKIPGEQEPAWRRVLMFIVEHPKRARNIVLFGATVAAVVGATCHTLRASPSTSPEDWPCNLAPEVAALEAPEIFDELCSLKGNPK